MIKIRLLIGCHWRAKIALLRIYTVYQLHIQMKRKTNG